MHLQGQDEMGRPFIAGLYPLMPDDTCKLLAVDFDSDNYQAESLSFLSICDRYHIPTYLERSRSGNGAHVWFFFKDFVKTSVARKMATLLLEATMAEHSSVTLASFDRLIPNQDTLPEGGFGNLIALPLQRQPRYQGNSVFVDRLFRPFDDQWQYLASVQKISIPDIHRVIGELAQTEKDFSNQATPQDHSNESQPFEIKPWEPETDNDQWKRIAESQTLKLTIVLANGLYFDKRELSPKLKSALCRLASFPNPVFFERQAKRFSTRNIPRFITCYEEKGNYLFIPRGLTDKIIGLFNDYHITYELLDKRSLGTRLDVKFQGTLRPKQRLVANQLLKNETGVLCASTGFGKTVIGLYALAQRGVSTLIITNRKELATQWRISAEIFLDLPRESIGTISSGKVKPSGIVDIATVQTLANQKDWQKEISRYGMIIVDECHHAAARQYESILKHYTSKYVLGLSATPRRRDGHQPIVYMQCGPVRYRVNHKKENHSQPLMHRLCVRPTQFKSTLISDGQKKIRIQNIFKELTLDQNRNALIISDVMMPGYNGFEITRKLKSDFSTSHIPIILLTALNAAESHLEGVKSGADSYITKPFSTKLLLASIFKLIEQRDKLKEKFSNDLSAKRPVMCTSDKDKEFVENLTKIVEEQLTNPEFTADDFASMMSLGRTIFYRKVRGVTGYTPKEYLRIMRMKKAAELLSTKKYTVSEVTYMVGINDPFYFSRCFKAQFGISPSSYQKRYQEGIRETEINED